MKPFSTEYEKQLKKLILRALIAYAGAIGVVAVALAISVAHGSGWRPALAGVPLYVILFGGVTYQLIKEFRAMKQEERSRSVSSEGDQ
ncbi:hypothetical protein BTH42_29795 [Burkholderia sp. SRS-W-2-2016]|uniref:hypothetical protein n=1 Tax=Burkholderia sp. SRS-W-2-2016 TaxID=1926878 RepID=UPI00094AA078|nr:hypothetical protein [Burkholderia sp. SRS-W-2-2016]OLL27986.1 hypothetical protein BTH42_29795 [Burkholderia sp. SRS-W-2-2016]